ncbi:MAG: hypothetical protein F4151_12340 [Gammaproteobacteria bacterium]|nr:hypothetical protein [Gammaproteobacteria bacterium]
MQGFGGFSDATAGRRCVNNVNNRETGDTPRSAPRDGPDDRDGWDAGASARLRDDLARFRAV